MFPALFRIPLIIITQHSAGRHAKTLRCFPRWDGLIAVNYAARAAGVKPGGPFQALTRTVLPSV